MTSDEQEFDIAEIHDLLIAAFTVKSLRRFCYQRPAFRPVLDEFPPDYGLADMVDRVVEYCRKHVLVGELLTEVQRANPRQYARFFEPELPGGEAEKTPQEARPETAAPDLLTLTRPFALDLVRVPAGEFRMGSDLAQDEDGWSAEMPPHDLYLPEFYIGKYPATNEQYLQFVRATGHRTPEHWAGGEMPRPKANHPVVHVDWHDALAFCDWLGRETRQPFRLPTEAEWEKAARGTGGRIYPWGNEPPDEARCNFDGHIGDTTAVGQYSPAGDSPYGCADMAGNVWERCQSLYKPYPYLAGDGREDLQEVDLRVLRGGAFSLFQWVVRCAYRLGDDPNSRSSTYGFRVCLAAGQE